jgi:hypothetical protein
MITFPIKNLFIEGPDCSGKTTLIRNIHNQTGYRWHIFDRSQISRSIFCKLYGREIDNISLDLHDEMSNLNNRFIILLPKFDVIAERFRVRGDEFHKDLESVESVYNAFCNQRENLNKFPNIRFYNTNVIVNDLTLSLQESESCSLDDISEMIKDFVRVSPNRESYPLSFTIYDDGEFKDADSSILDFEHEKEYYDMVRTSLLRKIDMELDGDNEYSRVEDLKSRRFVYSDSSCISFIQVAIRDGIMDFHCVIRSSDVENIFPHDLRFLYFLSSECFKKLGGAKRVRMRFNLNSAHIIG